MKKIKVLAVGPGAADYLPPLVAEEAACCDVLFGGRRNLNLFNVPGQEKIELKGQMAPLLALIKQKAALGQVGVLVSGDAGIYSILPRLTECFGRQMLEVYPGISAVQYLFARLNLTWQDALFLSLHGRDLNNLATVVAAHKKVVLFTDQKNSPATICQKLACASLKDKVVYVGENLSYSDEKISRGSFETFTNFKGSDLNLVVIVDG